MVLANDYYFTRSVEGQKWAIILVVFLLLLVEGALFLSRRGAAQVCAVLAALSTVLAAGFVLGHASGCHRSALEERTITVLDYSSGYARAVLSCRHNSVKAVHLGERLAGVAVLMCACAALGRLPKDWESD